MRNAVLYNESTVITIDNSGCIGNKDEDLVKVPNEITGYFLARVTILEQWCAGAEPAQLLLANFSGEKAWEEYIDGISQVFEQIDQPMPPLSGSTESNFHALQSAVSLTMIGEKVRQPSLENCHYYVVGKPLVGQEVMDDRKSIASLKELSTLIGNGIIQCIWPTGSKGIGAEISRVLGVGYTCLCDLNKSAGPSTAVIVAVKEKDISRFKEMISSPIVRIEMSL
ncbi:hypothetical protein [Lysinibacillus sp. 54212]|uniref:hypothetical protein n=1 Tax=Lysinibacillus sp. 54212 TaxID=3119829 RepID=UPI002FC9C7A7